MKEISKYLTISETVSRFVARFHVNKTENESFADFCCIVDFDSESYSKINSIVAVTRCYTIGTARDLLRELSYKGFYIIDTLPKSQNGKELVYVFMCRKADYYDDKLKRKELTLKIGEKEMKKWTIENTETLEYEGRTLHRVVLTENCQFGKKGDKMGWIEKEANLQEDAMVFDNAKIYNDAVVLGSARVHNNAVIYNNAMVCGNALISDNVSVSGSALIMGLTELHNYANVFGKAKIYGEAQIYNDARIYDNAEIGGTAVISDHAKVSNNAQVSEKAVVCGYAQVYGGAKVYGNAWIYGNAWVSGDTRVFDNAHVSGGAKVFDNAKIYEHAVVSGNAVVSSYAVIRGRAKVSSNKDYIIFHNWWSSSSGRYFTYLRSIDMYVVGCFCGTGKELINKADKDSKISGRNYEKIVKYVESIKKETKDANKIMNFIKWLFKDCDKSLLFGTVAIIYGITGVLLSSFFVDKTYIANVVSTVSLIVFILMVMENYIQYKKRRNSNEDRKR